jgi:hypothetical protein
MSARSEPSSPPTATVRPRVELLLLLAGAGLLAVAAVVIMSEVDRLPGALILAVAAVTLVLELPSRLGAEHAEYDEDIAYASAARRRAQA